MTGYPTKVHDNFCLATLFLLSSAAVSIHHKACWSLQFRVKFGSLDSNSGDFWNSWSVRRPRDKSGGLAALLLFLKISMYALWDPGVLAMYTAEGMLACSSSMHPLACPYPWGAQALQGYPIPTCPHTPILGISNYRTDMATSRQHNLPQFCPTHTSQTIPNSAFSVGLYLTPVF